MALFSVNQNVYWITANEVPTIVKSDNNIINIALGKKGVNINKNNGGYIKYVTFGDLAKNAGSKDFEIDLSTNDAGVNTVVKNNTYYTLNINVPNYHAIGDRHILELTYTVNSGSSASINGVLNKIKGSIAKDADYAEIFNTPTVTSNVVKLPAKGDNEDWILGSMSENPLTNIWFEFIEGETVYTQADQLNGNMPYGGIGGTVLVSGNITGKNHNPVTAADKKAALHAIADMEWFYLGEHGDQQRLKGYPYVNAAQLRDGYYQVKEGEFDLITIHHAYVGNGTFVQKSEQDVIIAVSNEEVGEGDNKGAISAKTIAAINTAFGTELADDKSDMVTF